jgi:hypothetical protein
VCVAGQQFHVKIKMDMTKYIKEPIVLEQDRTLMYRKKNGSCTLISVAAPQD